MIQARIRFLIILLFALSASVFLLFALHSGKAAANPRFLQRGAPRATPPPEGTEPLPQGAVIDTLLTNMSNPVALAFDPQGRLFYTEKDTGKVRLFENGTLQASPVITFSVDNCTERGLLGIVVDPDFSANHYIYVYYTAAADSCGSALNKVVRFVENNGAGSDPVEIFTSPQDAETHNGGALRFGPDGKLYVSVGDNDDSTTAQDVSLPNGKIHRINSDGTIPADNPVFTQTGALPSLFARGLRNSFGEAFDPVTGYLFASENGPYCDDELNFINGGYNYGWRASYPCDDPNPSPTYNTIPPLWYIPQANCCDAPTGLTFYTGNIPGWQNELFMSSFARPGLRHFYLDPTRRYVTAVNTVQGVTAMMDVATGPDGALWYIEGGGYETGTLKRIRVPGLPTFTPTISPTATATAIVTATPSATADPTPPALLVGHVVWQGRPAQPNALQARPITLTLSMGGQPFTFGSVTDASGYFTVSVTALTPGTYNWRAKGTQSLATGGTVAISGGTTSAEMGLQLAGDANNDNCDNVFDFNIVRGSFGRGSGDPGYDPRADFNGDGRDNVTDFTLLRNNFGVCGAP
jgi:glucose/arabinose dehydrogenase